MADKPLARRPAEPDAIDALARLPREIAAIKLENDNIVSLALAHPRNHEAIKADIVAQLKAYPSFAREAMYAKPVGRLETCPACGAKTRYKDKCPQCKAPVPQKIARGLSIRAAEAVAASFKYNAMRDSVTDLDADRVRLDVCFMDYQDGRKSEASAILSKTFLTSEGEIRRIADDRFYNVVCRARLAILKRGCILFVVPPGLRHELEEAADRELDAFLDDDTTKKVVAQFSQKQVSPEMIERFLAKPMARWTKEDRKILLGAWAALNSGESTVADLFESDDKTVERKEGGNERLAQTLGVAEAPAASADPAGDAIVAKRTDIAKRFEAMSVPVRGVFLSDARLASIDDVQNIADLAELERILLLAVNVKGKKPNGK